MEMTRRGEIQDAMTIAAIHMVYPIWKERNPS